SQAVELEWIRSLHVAFDFFTALGSGNASRNSRGVCRTAGLCRLDNDQVFFHGLNPACFKILFNVSGAKSSPGLPGTVTRLSLTGCLYWRWLPRVLASLHPSCSSVRMIS